MKKQLLLLGTVLCSSLLFAQQRVGINETTPSATLEVKGAGTGSATSAMLLKNNSSSLIMRVQDNGQIGVGTGTPQYILDVANRIRLRGGVANDIFTTPGMWFDDYRTTGSVGAERAFFGMRDSIRLGMYGGGSGGIGWGMNFNTKNGNVGIGSVDDFYRLTLSNSDYPLGFYNSSNSFFGDITVSSDTSLQIESRYGSFFGSTASKNILLNPPSSTFFFYPGNVGINVSVPTAKFQVGGNVMIGSGSPASGYLLSVNGKVICTEAKVQLSTSWPDYVFAPSYKMPTLAHLEKFIKKNNHLPNIPSAKEIEQDGLELGDMQKRTMEKVEELTLYLIELKKENDQLKKRINRLEKRK
ncbi:MAG: hypothetical protein V4722_07385 [Bacteroidota bacterium]